MHHPQLWCLKRTLVWPHEQNLRIKFEWGEDLVQLNGFNIFSLRLLLALVKYRPGHFSPLFFWTLFRLLHTSSWSRMVYLKKPFIFFSRNINFSLYLFTIIQSFVADNTCLFFVPKTERGKRWIFVPLSCTNYWCKKRGMR